MKKILIIGESSTFSHVGRPFTLAKELTSYNYDLHFACDKYYKNLLSEADLTHHPITSQAPEKFADNLNRGLPLYSKDTLSQYIEEDLRLIRSVKPDVIIGDFRLSLSISGRISNIPYINIINAHWSPYTTPYLPLPKSPLSKIVGYSVANKLFQLSQPAIFYPILRGVNSLRRKHHLKAYHSLMEYYSDGDITLYPDLENLFPVQNAPATHHYIGPIHFEPYCESPTWLNQIDKSKPIIYFTLGSSGDENVRNMMVQILGETPATILYANANRDTHCVIPQNFYSANYLPGMEICRLSDLVITHGGIPSVYQALEGSAPIIGLASNMDHLKSMLPIETYDFGTVIRSDQCTKEYISQVINKYLKNTCYKDKIRTFMDKQVTYNPGKTTNEIISRLLIS